MVEPKFIKSINGFDLSEFDKIDSTNLWIKSAIKAGRLNKPAVINALDMSGAKGQGSNKWHFQKGESLGFTMVFPIPKYYNSYLILINKWITLQCNKVLAEIAGESTFVKWPNDIYCNGKKLCGLLLECIDNSFLLAGIGINVNNREFPGLPLATSLAIESDRHIDIETLFEALLHRLTNLDLMQLPVQGRYVHNEFNKSLMGLNRECRVLHTSGEYETVIFRGVDEFGRALCENISTHEVRSYHHPSIRLTGFF